MKRSDVNQKDRRHNVYHSYGISSADSESEWRWNLRKPHTLPFLQWQFSRLDKFFLCMELINLHWNSKLLINKTMSDAKCTFYVASSKLWVECTDLRSLLLKLFLRNSILCRILDHKTWLLCLKKDVQFFMNVFSLRTRCQKFIGFLLKFPWKISFILHFCESNLPYLFFASMK